MGSLHPSPELTLDFNPIFIPKSINQFIQEISRISSVTERVLQVDDFVNRLETETRKIEAFKRELPLCMLLINDAIVSLKEESMLLKKSSKPEPVLEEFIPLKNSSCHHDDEKYEVVGNQNDNGDKKNWLSSTQLWSTNENLNQKPNSIQQTIKKRTEEQDSEIPFFSPGIKNPMRGNGLLTEVNRDSRLIPCSTPNFQSNIRIGGSVPPPPPQQQTSRKQRRSWSTELHRRFVNALQQLGGSQAATPKQIRELMQVDGLTNDEVKSHLQKYRLHTRRQPSSNTNQSNVVLEGGLWMQPHDKYGGSSKSSNSHTNSPDGPFTNGGNNMEDEEDEKSENYCWNGNL